jgi:hypothetical protein
MLGNPMDWYRKQFHLVGKTGTEQPKQRKENKEIDWQCEEKQ